MTSDGRIKNLEDEFKLLKGEIKAVLLDIRGQVMRQDSPFSAERLNNMWRLPAEEEQAPVVVRQKVEVRRNGDKRQDAFDDEEEENDLPAVKPLENGKGPKVVPAFDAPKAVKAANGAGAASDLDALLGTGPGPEPGPETDAAEEPASGVKMEAVAKAPFSARNPVDINLVTALMRWTWLCRGQLGDKGLAWVMQLYFASYHGSPGLRDLVLSIASQEEQTKEDGPKGQDGFNAMDLLHQLHGILTSSQVGAYIPVYEVGEEGKGA